MINFSDFRVSANHGPYPPYHTGLYLEDYFYNYYQSLKIKPERKYIPVTWTSLYTDNATTGLQKLLNQLDPNDKYFAVSQHDDAIKEKLPNNTLCFNAGGNNGGIPIPLVCSPIPNIPKNDKEYLCSFVGSITHPIREALYETLKDKTDCFIQTKKWHPSVGEDQYSVFIESATKSKFLLCPRGYGLNSFRLYEAFQLGCVPVIITDKFFLPWEDDLYWPSFAVLINHLYTKSTYEILNDISDKKYNDMLKLGRSLYPVYFTLEATCKNILERIS